MGIPYRLSPSEVLLGRLLLQTYLLGISMLPCVHFLLQIVGWQVMDYVIHKLNIVRHE